MNHISLKKAGFDATQNHPLQRMRFGEYQASSAAYNKLCLVTHVLA